MKKEMDNTGFRRVVRREIKRMRSRLVYLFIVLILPLATFGIFIAMFSGNTLRNLPVAVLDNDNSALSRKLIRTIDALPSVEIAMHAADMSECRKSLVSGDVYACIIIPKNYEHDILRGSAPKIINYYNNQYLLIGGTLSRDIMTAVRTVSGTLNLANRIKKGESPAQALVNISPIELQTHQLFNPYTNYTYYLVTPLLPTMLHIFVILSAIFALGTELKEGSAGELLKTAGGSVNKAVFGKLLPYTVIFYFLALFMLVLLFACLDLPLKGSFPVMAAASLLFIVAYQCAGVLIVAVSANLRLGLMGASFYASTAFTFVGITFPMISMPLAARIWGEALPLTHYIRIIMNESLRGSSLRQSVISFGFLLAFTALPFLLNRRLYRIFTEKRFHGGV